MKYRFKTILLCLVLAALLLPLAGCDSASNPIAPNNSILTVVASPTKIGLRGESSTITVTGFRPDGNPLSEGTLVIMSTDLGTLSATSLRIDANGVATATLTGDGREGPASVTASLATTSGGGDTGGGTSGMATVQIAEEKPQLTVSANPSTIPVLSTSTITVLARDDDGFFLGAGERIILTSDLGSVPSEVQTDSSGRATFKFRAGEEGGTGRVTAFLGNSDEATVDITIRQAVGGLTLTASPSSITRNDTGVSINLEAFVTTAQGNPQPSVNVTFEADRGTLNPATDLTDNNGLASVTLQVTAEDVCDITSFMVNATAISEGEPFDDPKTIIVQGPPPGC